MKNKKIETFAVASLMALNALVGASSCNDNEKAGMAAEKARTEIEKARKEEAKKKEAEKAAVFKHVFDSVLNASGYQEYQKELHSMPGKCSMELQMDSIQYSKTLGGTIEAEVIKTSRPIIEEYSAQMHALLAKYSLGFDSEGSSDSVAYMYEFLSDEDCNYESLWAMKRIVEDSEYGESRKKEICEKMDAIHQGARKKILANKKAVEKRYANYYLVDDDSHLGFAEGEGGAWLDYHSLNDDYCNPKTLVTEKFVSVYDQKLPVDFFGNPGVKYKLVSIGQNKWQVVTINKNGAVIGKTKVFEDAKEFSTRTYREEPEDNIKVGDSEFSFEPGKNEGVRVNYSEITKVQKRKQNWIAKYTNAEQKMIDSLSGQIKRIEHLNSICDSLHTSAYNRANEYVKRCYGE